MLLNFFVMQKSWLLSGAGPWLDSTLCNIYARQRLGQQCVASALLLMAALVLLQSGRNTGYDKSAVEVDPSQPAFTRRREVCAYLFHPHSLPLLLFIGASQQVV